MRQTNSLPTSKIKKVIKSAYKKCRKQPNQNQIKKIKNAILWFKKVRAVETKVWAISKDNASTKFFFPKHLRNPAKHPIDLQLIISLVVNNYDKKQKKSYSNSEKSGQTTPPPHPLSSFSEAN